MKIKAAVCREKGALAIEEVELAAPKMGEILVKMVASGVCHTDASARNLFIPAILPMVLGHEGVGIVESVGEGVSEFVPGDKVIISFPYCGECEYCRSGHPYACEDSFPLFFHGKYKDGTTRITGADGTEIGSLFGQGSFGTYAVCDASSAVKVDVGIEDLKALCSLGCGVQTGAGAVLNRMAPRPGTTIAVFGCGAVGIAAIMAAKIAGCSTIIGIDIVPSRLQLALECGATDVINGKECADVPAEIRRLCDGKGAHFALEASGVPALGLQMLDSMRREGLAVIVSVMGDKTMPVLIENQIMSPSVTLAGIVEGGSNPKVFIPELVKYYKEGRLPVGKMANYYKFEDIEEAFEASHNGSVIKPVLVF